MAMAPRYLSLSELVYVRWRASETLRRQRTERPRRAARVRSYISGNRGLRSYGVA